jgi:uncharacterized repeat protein (TIGR02543 family)
MFVLVMSFMQSSCKNEAEEHNDQFTVTFDTRGGSPTPLSRKVIAGMFTEQPAVDPVKGDSVFIGWFTSSNLKFNFKSNPVNQDLTLYAKWWGGTQAVRISERL